MVPPRTSKPRIALAGLLLIVPASAPALVGDTDGWFGLDGSLRTITAATVHYDHPLLGENNPGDGFSQTLLRITAEGNPAQWLWYEVHVVQSLSFSSNHAGAAQGLGQFGAQGQAIRYRALDASWSWADESDLQARLWLDRFNLKMVLPFADITIGRQAITFGKAYFWNPLDVFLAFDPTQFDRDYKAGVDALRVELPLGDFTGLSLVAVLGGRIQLDLFSQTLRYEDEGDLHVSWYGSALLARFFTNLAEWDLAVQAGKVYGGYQLGAAASGELGPLAVRAEAAYLFAVDSANLPFSSQKEINDHLTAVVGLGHRFESSLDIEAEYLFNAAGDPDNLEASMLRMSLGGTLHLGRHLLGVSATYEILPILNGSLAWIFSFSDGSSLIQPGLWLSVSDEADFLFGALIALGPRPTGPSREDPGLQSEFGTYPNFYYMEFKFYF